MNDRGRFLVLGGVFALVSACVSRAPEAGPRFVEVELLQIVPHRTAGLVGRSLPVRAFLETTESGGVVPSKIVDLPDKLAIRGIALSPDGTQIAYSEARPDTDDEKVPDGFVSLKGCNIKGVNMGEGGRIQFTVGDFKDVDPYFDTDGKHLLFASDRRRRHRADILRILRAGRGGIQDIHVDFRDMIVLSPSRARDETTAFSLFPGAQSDEAPQVWTVSGPRVYPTQICSGTEPALAPDGSRITYVGADQNLWVCNSDGTGRSQLTHDADVVSESFLASLSSRERSRWPRVTVRPYGAPTWTPDGSVIVFSAMNGLDATGRPNHDIWSIRGDGTQRSQLTTNGSLDTFPRVSPDSRQIYFVSNRGGQWAIWRMDAPEWRGS